VDQPFLFVALSLYPPGVLDWLIAKTTCGGNSCVAGNSRVAGRAEGSTPLVNRSLCDNPMDGSCYFLSMRNNLWFRERKKSRVSWEFLASKALLDWNEFNMSKFRAKGIN
jgi:hypothetical protein